jgi:hypothetical protein
MGASVNDKVTFKLSYFFIDFFFAIYKSKCFDSALFLVLFETLTPPIKASLPLPWAGSVLILSSLKDFYLFYPEQVPILLL